MLFTNISFLYYFLPALIIIYFITPKKYKNIILLIASLLFYFYGEPKYVFLMILEIIIAYIGAILIDKYKNQSKNILITTLFIHIFLLIIFKGDILTGIFTTDAVVVQKGYDYLKGFALETIVTAILFSMIGYFNGHDKTIWVMAQGLIQTLLVRLPLAYYMSIQPDASLTKIGFAAPAATIFGILLNVVYLIFLKYKKRI